jgi:hypothetical protein
VSGDRQERERDPNEIGALWLKEGPKGPYLSGNIEGIGPVVCFEIRSNNPRAPKYRVLKSVPRDERPAPRRDRNAQGRDENEVGALWYHEGQKGEYLTGTIEGVGAVVCFQIRSTSPKAPLWRVLKSVPQDRDERPASSQRLDDRAPRERRPSRVDDFDDTPPDFRDDHVADHRSRRGPREPW